ncbi:hypothetical protein KIPB_015985, partial [Kipferlia bialata]
YHICLHIVKHVHETESLLWGQSGPTEEQKRANEEWSVIKSVPRSKLIIYFCCVTWSSFMASLVVLSGGMFAAIILTLLSLSLSLSTPLFPGGMFAA